MARQAAGGGGSWGGGGGERAAAAAGQTDIDVDHDACLCVEPLSPSKQRRDRADGRGGREGLAASGAGGRDGGDSVGEPVAGRTVRIEYEFMGHLALPERRASFGEESMLKPNLCSTALHKFIN